MTCEKIVQNQNVRFDYETIPMIFLERDSKRCGVRDSADERRWRCLCYFGECGGKRRRKKDDGGGQ